jgi:hypothetical protein
MNFKVLCKFVVLDFKMSDFNESWILCEGISHSDCPDPVQNGSSCLVILEVRMAENI